jgi:hypothetical protein
MCLTLKKLEWRIALHYDKPKIKLAFLTPVKDIKVKKYKRPYDSLK